MDTPRRVEYSERNPKTHALHKREVFWQISLPLIIGTLVLVAAVVAIILSALQPVTDLERWADVSLIWIILPSLFFALIMLAVLVALVFVVSLMLRSIPRYARILQLYFELGKSKIYKLANLLVEPILKVNSLSAAARRASRLGRKEAQE